MAKTNPKIKRAKKTSSSQAAPTRVASRSMSSTEHLSQVRAPSTTVIHQDARPSRALATSSNRRVPAQQALSRRSLASSARTDRDDLSPLTPAAPAPTLDSHVSKYPAVPSGQGASYRIHFYKPNSDTTKEENMISPWHDIPLFNPDETFNYVNEIPKNSRAKYEIDTRAAFNPIRQDTKNNDLRFFKYGNLPFNYGALPQTWEDPLHIDPHMKLGGDKDPLDVVELSPAPLEAGHVYRIKIIGVLALIDEDEVDWKLLGIHAEHPLAAKLHDVANLETVLPGAEHRLKEWFRMYKTPDGKPENKFGFKDRLLNRDFAYSVIDQTHESWKQLQEAGYDNLWTGVEQRVNLVKSVNPLDLEVLKTASANMEQEQEI